MRYILDCVNEKGLELEIIVDYKFVCITICDDQESKSIYLDENSVYQLIGALHHIQKQLKGNTNG